MNRRSLAVLSGLIVSSSFAAVAWAQTATRQPTLAERMAALRRGWSVGQQKPEPIEPSPSAQRGVPHASGQSFLPNGTQGRYANPQPAQRAQAPSSMNAAARTASRPRVGSVQAVEVSQSRQQSFTLPGLGGSPLPDTATTQQRQESPAANNISRELANDSPVIQPEASSAAESRYGSSPTRTAQVDPSAVRRSPQRRAALQIGPNDLQRELVGAFPTTPTTAGPAATSPPSDVSDAGQQAPARSESRLAMPEAEQPVSKQPKTNEWSFEVADGADTVEDSTAKSTEQQSDPPSNADAPSDPVAAPESSIDMRSAFGDAAPSATERSLNPSALPSSNRHREAFGETAQPAAPGDPTVLVSQQTPVITTDIRGPRQILVGREATYRVRLDNQGSVAAEGIVASIRIPSWADVIDTTTSHGTIQQSQSGGANGTLEWQLVRLDARASETLDVRLVPRTSRPLELGVSYTVAPVGSRAIVEVQEPKLGIHVSGPDEVMYGKPQLFRLTITNPGTGAAENVKIDLLPPGGGEAAVSSHPLGDLPAGASKTVEVELTARESGKLAVKAHATAEGGLTADADKEIFCRKPELEVDWRGPEQKYAGTQATYFFRVRNPGTAPAEDVTVRVSLPEGAEYAGASEGQSLDAERREVSWRVGALGPGDDYYMELKCLMKTPGANQLTIAAATASGDLTTNKLAETNVVALADLKLEISDPRGPIAVGEEAVYEIHVKNRGACAARDVNIVALFSEGIEPDQVEGALYSVADGRVSFRTIEELPVGRQIALRIRAHAAKPGTHVFRAEVLCRDLEIKLAAEETTRFYADDLPTEAGAKQQAASRSEQFDQPAVR